MRWVTLTLLLALLALSGCSDSYDSAPDTSTTETSEARVPRAYRELMAQLPPFDEPASPEVTAYRLARIGASSGRCAGSGGARKAAFRRANARVFEYAGMVRGARLVANAMVGQRDGNGCPEGAGPPAYFTTVRTYRLSAGTTAADVFEHYERVLHYGWLETSGARPCERRFSQGAGYLEVDTCDGRLTLTALGREPMPLPTAERLPARPFGLRYPAAADQPPATEPTYEVTSGDTCERASTVDVPSVIVPPPPGVRADLRDGRVVVEWSFERVLGDCPPRLILLSFRSANSAASSYAARVAVHDHSGAADIRLSRTLATPTLLRATTESVDGTRSRTVTVLIRRQT